MNRKYFIYYLCYTMAYDLRLESPFSEEAGRFACRNYLGYFVYSIFGPIEIASAASRGIGQRFKARSPLSCRSPDLIYMLQRLMQRSR